MTHYELVDAAGVRLAYRAWGEPGAVPLVLLHGIGGGGPGDWDTVAAGLSDRFRVYAVDQRGHGRSDRADAYSIDLLVADLAQLLDALGLDRIVLVGHSLGGVVAYLFAARHPHRLRALVVEDAGLMYPRTPVPPQRPDGELPFDWNAVLALRGQIDAPDPGWRDEARTIGVPTLLVAGGPTSHVRQETITELAGALPQGRLCTIEAGHLVHGQQPRRFLGAVRGFLDDVAP
ncbi:alpha/beta fold hydrolase [Catellatospora tritici]|uniref:alpha/beta fold hydrolase n=1 Tax=Catellatospora tritici TaxID=2851566 RepID=UPI001C2DEF11|nr:alpha/beta hydrolase [Catellatospora tritici]MBV1853698.1 alpha/beta hydrolase [Catellatospora tritici]